jgi:DNA-3-methyladenine glycosylase
VARELVGKVLRRRWRGLVLAAAVVEAEAYYLDERGSHASLGRTPSREALWAPGGTIYMYYSRGGDSLNVSCAGGGDAVLFKSGLAVAKGEALEAMLRLNPRRDGGARAPSHLCSGQTLLCRALDLRVPEWDGRPFDDEFHVEDAGYRPPLVVRTTRLGIPAGRDEHLMLRFVDADRARHATSNPLSKRGWSEGREYELLTP